MDDIKVSILIPIYGVEKYIERCAISLFEQSYMNLEYIFVNDCTKDRSMSVLENVIKKYPFRQSQIKIISHELNRGLAAARNTCISNATGDFVLHVDSDDYIDKDFVKRVVDKQNSDDSDIVIVNYVRAYPNFEMIVQHSSFTLKEDYCISVIGRSEPNNIWGKLIRRSLYTKNNIKCSEGNNQGEDYQVLPLLLFYARKISNLSQALYYYECSNENAYSNSFSISKHDQNWNSMDVVMNFFKDKGYIYYAAIQKGRIRQIADDFIISAKSEGIVSNCYYNDACNKLKDIEYKFWNSVPIAKRVILFLSRNFKIMSIYILTLRKLHYVFMSFKAKLKHEKFFTSM